MSVPRLCPRLNIDTAEWARQFWTTQIKDVTCKLLNSGNIKFSFY